MYGLNAPTGAWCSLTRYPYQKGAIMLSSQCTYRCVVLPDFSVALMGKRGKAVSMHLQVRGAP